MRPGCRAPPGNRTLCLDTCPAVALRLALDARSRCFRWSVAPASYHGDWLLQSSSQSAPHALPSTGCVSRPSCRDRWDWDPFFFPAQGGFRHRPVHTQPLPVNPTEFIKLLDSGLPEGEEDAGLHPLLKAIMGRRVRTQLGLIQGLPLASRAQHVEDGIGTVAIRHPWASSSKAMRIHMHRQQRVQLRPQLIRNAKARGRAIIRRPLSFSFSFLGFLSVHTPILPRFRVIRIGSKYNQIKIEG